MVRDAIREIASFAQGICARSNLLSWRALADLLNAPDMQTTTQTFLRNWFPGQ